MILDARLCIDHELLAVEQDHRVHCILELIAPSAPSNDRRKHAPRAIRTAVHVRTRRPKTVIRAGCEMHEARSSART